MSLTASSIGRKVAMALSGIFLVLFLTQHFSINLLSVFSESLFNQVSHFMGNNPIVQFILQPILIFGVLFHFVMGFVLELKNRNARTTDYAYKNPSTSSSWMSRNMIISGITVLAFLALHFIDFWIPEINTKYIVGDMSGLMADGSFRYFHELQHEFQSLPRVIAYVLAFGFLSLHLLHGFKSSFQSVGLTNGKKRVTLHKFGNVFAIAVPLGFVFIALFHFLTQSH